MLSFKSMPLAHESEGCKSKITAVLFDLDGTLLDTAPDLAAALNALLLTQRLQPLPLAVIRPSLSDGAAGLLKLGFNITKEDPAFPRLRQQFIDYYSQHICDHTQLFSGVDQLIHYLQANHVPWGIVTNKLVTLDFLQNWAMGMLTHTFTCNGHILKNQ